MYNKCENGVYVVLDSIIYTNKCQTSLVEFKNTFIAYISNYFCFLIKPTGIMTWYWHHISFMCNHLT